MGILRCRGDAFTRCGLHIPHRPRPDFPNIPARTAEPDVYSRNSPKRTLMGGLVFPVESNRRSSASPCVRVIPELDALYHAVGPLEIDAACLATGCDGVLHVDRLIVTIS